MRRRPGFAAVLSLLLSIAATSASRGADVLSNVPPDAYGFVIVKNIASTDADVSKLLKTLGVNLPGPFEFLKAAAGLSDGLDPNGDFLLVAFPEEAVAESTPKFAVWLPINDYERLLATLDASPAQPIAAVTIAGEDVLLAQHGTWALIMDPDQRSRMEATLAADAATKADAVAEQHGAQAIIHRWKEWIDANDVTIVALPSGIRALRTWAQNEDPAHSNLDPQAVPLDDADDVFGFAQPIELEDAFAAVTDPAPDDLPATVRAAIRQWSELSPRMEQFVMEANAVGTGLRLDAEGNAVVSVRLSSTDKRGATEAHPADEPLPPALYQGGEFVFHGAGVPPGPLRRAAAEFFVQSIINDLVTQERMVFNEAQVRSLRAAAEDAAAEVRSFLVLNLIGDTQQGTYTNNFAVVRTTDAPAFTDHATKAMDLWNTANRDAQGETRLIFDTEQTQVAGTTATQYTLDIAAVEGAADIPEVREAMEKLFGPGGKLRLWIVPVDQQHVLLAAATPEQVAAALQKLDRNQPVEWSHAEVAPANGLLPDEAAWRVFFSPHGYNRWLQRQSDAVVGPVLGGPLVKNFPASPPIGAAGGFRDGELWLDVAIPAATIQNAGTYLNQ